MTKRFDLLKKAHSPLFNCEPKKEYAYYEVFAGEYFLRTPDYEEAVAFYDKHPMLPYNECLYGVIVE